MPRCDGGRMIHGEWKWGVSVRRRTFTTDRWISLDLGGPGDGVRGGNPRRWVRGPAERGCWGDAPLGVWLDEIAVTGWGAGPVAGRPAGRDGR